MKLEKQRVRDSHLVKLRLSCSLRTKRLQVEAKSPFKIRSSHRKTSFSRSLERESRAPLRHTTLSPVSPPCRKSTIIRQLVQQKPRSSSVRETQHKSLLQSCTSLTTTCSEASTKISTSSTSTVESYRPSTSKIEVTRRGCLLLIRETEIS